MTHHPVPVKPIIQYVGSKMSLAARIVALFPAGHTSYVEPYVGSAAVLLAKPRVPVELINDYDGGLINLYRLLQRKETRYDLIDALNYTPYSRREFEVAMGRHDPDGYDLKADPIEWARRFMVRTNQRYVGGSSGTWTSTIRGSSGHSNASKWQNYRERLNAVAHRLEEVQIDCDDALSVLARLWNKGGPEIAVYLDPPYVMESRAGALYLNDELSAHHERLLHLAAQLTGPVVISGYESDLYDDKLGAAGAGWAKYAIPVKASGQAGKGRTSDRVEVLWANPQCVVPPWSITADAAVDPVALVDEVAS